MGYLSLGCALAGLASIPIPGAGKYLAIGLGIFAIAAGVLGWRGGGPARARLCGAAAVAVGIVAVLLGGAKVGLTLVALDRLESWLSP